MLKKNIAPLIVALIITYLSLANAEKFEKISLHKIPYIDKIVHTGMYFLLMLVIIVANRKKLKSKISLFLTAFIPLFYSALMEILQVTVTVNRSGSFLDIIFNLAGILLAILIWLLFKPHINLLVK